VPDVAPTALADLGADWPSDWFTPGVAEACSEISLDDLRPILAAYCDDADQIKLHYPWVAWALVGYRHEQQRRKPEVIEEAKVQARLQGREFHELDFASGDYVKLLRHISALATQLYDALDVFDDRVSAAISNPQAWRVYMAARQDILQEFGDDAGVARENFLEWMIGLVALRSGIESAADRISGAETLGLSTADRLPGKRSRTSIAARRGERLKGLDNFVFLLGRVWHSMTGRQPSASRGGNAKDEPSKFVRFVSNVAGSQGLPQPSITQVKGSLDRMFRAAEIHAQTCATAAGPCL